MNQDDSTSNVARRGFGALTRGGTEALSNDELKQLIETTTNAAKNRNLSIPQEEVEYLQKYMDINNQFLDSRINTRQTRQKIDKLNKEYSHLSEKVLRKGIMGGHLAGYYEGEEDDPDMADHEGWVPSQVCW